MNEKPPQLARVLGLRDLALFLVAALINLNSVPVVASAGPSALLFWLSGFLLFFLPQAVAVLELSHRYPEEGGIYNWSKKAFGDFHGFLSGWCYWTNNIFYIPTLLFYIVGFGAFIGGDKTRDLGSSPLFMASVSLLLLWTITGLNILGLRVGKWIQTVGASGTFVTASLILIVGAVRWKTAGLANAVDRSTLLPGFGDWKTLSLLSVVCLNYVGLELGSVLGEEIKTPRRNIPRAAIFAGISTVATYLVVTLALLAAIPSREIGVISGILDAVKRVASDTGMPWVVVPIAVLMTLNAAGNTSAWLSGAARIPFVIGLDKYLPDAFGRVHGRFGTPHVALVVQGLASSLFIVVNSIGSSVHDMYMSLVQTTVVLQLIPYLYMFAALIRMRFEKASFGRMDGFFRRDLPCYMAGVVGFVMSAFGLLLAFVPGKDVADPQDFEFKIVLGTLSFFVPGFLIFRWNGKKRKVAAAAAPERTEPVSELP